MTERHPTDRPEALEDRPRRQFRYVPVQRDRKLNRWYSRVVGLLKFVLPAIAAVLMVLVALWPKLQKEPPPASVEVVESRDGTVQMLSPRYFGVDENDQPFSLAAKSASQAAEDEDVVELTAPEGEIALSSGDGLSLNADHGRYNRGTNLLNLSGDVTLIRDDGVEVHTPVAHIDLAERSAWGDAPVHAKGPKGTIESEGFRIADEGATVIFTGRSSLVFHGSGAEEEE